MTNHNENIDTSIGCNDMFHARKRIILQQFLKAKEILQAVITKRKDAAAPHFHLGFVYVELMCHLKALEHFKEAARLKPKIKKYRQVETWFSQLYDTYKSLKSESDFMKAIASLIIDINPTKFEYINKFYNATTEEILLALNDAILLYHPMNYHVENEQQFLLNKYSYISLTRYKNCCRTHFGYAEIDPDLYSHYLQQNIKYLPVYSSWQQRAGVQMVVQKARSCYPREPITHSTNGKMCGASISSGGSDEEWLQQNKKYILMNKLKRMCLIYGYIRKNKINPITDIIQLIDIFFHENVWEWKAVDQSAACDQYTTYFDLQGLNGECPFHIMLSHDHQNSVDLFLRICVPKVVISFIKIYYELYVYDGNKKNINMKGTMKYRLQDDANKDNKISSQFRLFTNNNDMNLMIRFLSVEYLRFENYLQHTGITIKENVSFKWTISTNFKHKPEPSIQFSPNFKNWCLYSGHNKNPTHKKKKKFYIGVMLITLPSPVNHLKIQLNIFNDDKKNTKVFVNKVWPGFESALQIPFKYEILYQQSLSIHVNIKILNAFDHKGKKINIKDASMELL